MRFAALLLLALLSACVAESPADTQNLDPSQLMVLPDRSRLSPEQRMTFAVPGTFRPFAAVQAEPQAGGKPAVPAAATTSRGVENWLRSMLGLLRLSCACAEPADSGAFVCAVVWRRRAKHRLRTELP